MRAIGASAQRRSRGPLGRRRRRRRKRAGKGWLRSGRSWRNSQLVVPNLGIPNASGNYPNGQGRRAVRRVASNGRSWRKADFGTRRAANGSDFEKSGTQTRDRADDFWLHGASSALLRFAYEWQARRDKIVRAKRKMPCPMMI